MQDLLSSTLYVEANKEEIKCSFMLGYSPSVLCLFPLIPISIALAQWLKDKQLRPSVNHLSLRRYFLDYAERPAQSTIRRSFKEAFGRS